VVFNFLSDRITSLLSSTRESLSCCWVVCVVEQSDGVTDRVMEIVKESNAS
jgi:hypothetical protein